MSEETSQVSALRNFVKISRSTDISLDGAKEMLVAEWLSQALAKHHNNQCAIALDEKMHRNTPC